MPFFPSIGRLVDRAYAAASAIAPRAARLAGGRLLRQRRFDEAEALLAAAAVRFPRQRGILARHALAAQVDGRFAVAAQRWRELCVLSPKEVVPWLRLAECARHLGDVEGASEASLRALSLRPNDWRSLYEAAHAHHCADRHDEAVAIWARLATRRPHDPNIRQSFAHCLIRLGRLDEAERQIEAGLRRHPDDRALGTAKGVLAMRREEWDDAHAIWSDFVAAHPDDEDGHLFLSRVASVRQLEMAAAVARPQQLRAPVDIARVEDEAIRQLMLRFEGIGADCEFGAVQRRYGAEPLGLLRWNDVTFSTLAAALEARFADMGEPETTELSVGEIDEVYVRDRRWDLGMHTFLLAHEVSPETLLPKMCRRVAYLRDKFLDDLASAEKVFVFKSRVLRFEDLVRLHEMLRAYGAIRLLHVRPAVSAGIPPWPVADAGAVVEIAPDLHVGYVTRMGDLTDIPFDEWVTICRTVSEKSGIADAAASADQPEPWHAG